VRRQVRRGDERVNAPDAVEASASIHAIPGLAATRRRYRRGSPLLISLLVTQPEAVTVQYCAAPQISSGAIASGELSFSTESDGISASSAHVVTPRVAPGIQAPSWLGTSRSPDLDACPAERLTSSAPIERTA